MKASGTPARADAPRSSLVIRRKGRPIGPPLLVWGAHRGAKFASNVSSRREDILQPDGKIAHPDARRMVERVSDCRIGTDVAELAGTLHAELVHQPR